MARRGPTPTQFAKGPAGTLHVRQHRRLGWIRDLPDTRDRLYSVSLKALQALPDAVDLRDQCPPIYDQGEIGSCTANAIAGAIQFDRKRAGVSPDFIPSRLFIYYNERVIEQDVPLDRGAQLRDGIKSVAQLGVCPEASWPYQVVAAAYDGGPFPDGSPPVKQPPQACYDEATKYKATSYQRLTQTVSQLRGCLAEGFPFVFGFAMYDSFFIDGTNRQQAVIPLPTDAQQSIGGHAVMAVGYDDKKQLFIIRNSWGRDQGEGGYFYMPYSYLTDSGLSSDFWVIQAVGDGTPATAPDASAAGDGVTVVAAAPTRSVLTIHGVNVRSAPDFTAQVTALGLAAQRQDLALQPVFWGDLGGRDFIPELIPQDQPPAASSAASAAREQARQLDARAIGSMLVAPPAGVPPRLSLGRPMRGHDMLADSLIQAISGSGVDGATLTTDTAASAVQQAVGDAMLQHPWIDQVTDPAVHDAIARTTAAMMARQSAGSARGFMGLFNPLDALKGLLRSALNEVLLLVADALASAGNGYVRQLREAVMPTVGRFTGDIWAYLSNPGPIRDRILGAIPSPTLGRSQSAPIDVIAHSFGGVIAVHMAVRKLLYIDTLITFGSQPSLFEVIMADYAPVLGAFAEGKPVTVPGVINKWINLWEPLDFLAFVQSPVFTLAGGGGPTDVRVPHEHDSGLFTHGVYWTHPLLAQVIRTAL